jgi:hypothetical protein
MNEATEEAPDLGDHGDELIVRATVSRLTLIVGQPPEVVEAVVRDELVRRPASERGPLVSWAPGGDPGLASRLWPRRDTPRRPEKPRRTSGGPSWPPRPAAEAPAPGLTWR